MAASVQVTFRDIPHSDAVEQHAERLATKLDTFYDRITKTHVVIEKPHRRHKHGKGYHVGVTMHVPGRELAVTRNPYDDREELHATLDAAFDDAQRVLEKFASELKLGQRQNHSKPAHGRVTKVFHDRGYGFLESEDGVELYFHRNSVLNGKFDRLFVGCEVRYAEEMGIKGPQASTVDIAGKG